MIPTAICFGKNCVSGLWFNILHYDGFASVCIIYWNNIARSLKPGEENETLKFYSFEMMQIVKAEMLHKATNSTPFAIAHVLWII